MRLKEPLLVDGCPNNGSSVSRGDGVLLVVACDRIQYVVFELCAYAAGIFDATETNDLTPNFSLKNNLICCFTSCKCEKKSLKGFFLNDNRQFSMCDSIHIF